MCFRRKLTDSINNLVAYILVTSWLIATYIVEEVLRFEIDPQYSKLFSSIAVNHNSVLSGRTNESESIRDNGSLVLHH